jgi:hypothetical protein
MRLRFTLSIAAAALALAAAPLLAHHGWSGNGQDEFELVGTVERDVSLAGPHATMQIRADDRVWDITLAPGARTRRAGLAEGVIPLGAEVTIHGHRSSDPNRHEIKAERVTWNGRTFDVYPDRD